MGWIALAVAAGLVTALVAGWRYAHATNSVALLDLADRVLAGNSGSRVALRNTAFGADPAQRLDVIAPDGPGPHPVLVFIHGGGWHSGVPGEYGFIGRHFARAGYVVVLPGYRLGKEGRYPHMLQDGAAALAWVQANMARLGGDPQRVFVMGHSAGAYNAVMLALEPRWLAEAGVPGVSSKAWSACPVLMTSIRSPRIPRAMPLAMSLTPAPPNPLITYLAPRRPCCSSPAMRTRQ